MYINLMHIRSSRDSLVAHSDAHKFQANLREWRKHHPNTPDHAMPSWLAELKAKAEISAARNFNTQAVKSAMDLHPPTAMDLYPRRR